MSEAEKAPAISIIVPVFNTEAYLEKCIGSLISQTFTDIEIICVNDGSTDRSLEMLRFMAAGDSRIVVVDQLSSGVATARNNGLANAKAPFIMFCDSDDWFDSKMCEEMLGALLDHHADAVICGWNIIYEIPDNLKQGADEYYRLRYSGLVKITSDTMLNTDISLCNKLFRRAIIDRYDIGFLDGKLYEDAYFCDLYMMVSNTLYYLDKPYYNYLRRERSIMSETYRKSSKAADHLDVAFGLYGFLTRHGMLQDNRGFFWQRFVDYSALAVRHVVTEDRSMVRSRIRTFYRNHRHELLDPAVSKRSRFPQWLRLLIACYPEQADVLRRVKRLLPG